MSNQLTMDELLKENEILRSALRYISCPTMSYPGTTETVTPELWPMVAPSEQLIRLALTTCIRTATKALSDVQNVGHDSPLFDYMVKCRDERDALLDGILEAVIEAVPGVGNPAMTNDRWPR